MDTKNFFLSLLNQNRPDAAAVLHGNAEYPDISGIVQFYALPESGILIAAEISGLPEDESESPAFFALHIHENGDCSGNFENTGSHYNPEHVPHPEHAGDLPPLLSNNGYAWMIFYDDYLTVPMILNRSLIIHRDPDDFTSQPSGNAGEKIACGVIKESNAVIQSY